MKKQLKKYLISGLLVLIPISLTLYILYAIISFLDRLYPIELFPFYFPGMGIILTFFTIFLAGIIARNYLGKKFLPIAENVIGKIPLINALYNPIKQIAEAVFSAQDKNFRRVVLIEYPRKGLYCLAFVTGVATGEIQEKTAMKVINVFVPTTPNPTSGFYIMVPESDVIPLDMTPEHAFRTLISGGMAGK